MYDFISKDTCRVCNPDILVRFKTVACFQSTSSKGQKIYCLMKIDKISSNKNDTNGLIAFHSYRESPSGGFSLCLLLLFNFFLNFPALHRG